LIARESKLRMFEAHKKRAAKITTKGTPNMPEWLKNLIAKLRAANPNLTDAQVAELQTELENAVPKAAATAPAQSATAKETAAAAGIPPEVLQRLDAQDKSVSSLVASMEKLVKDLDERHTQGASERAAAMNKRYTDHIDQLQKDLKLTKAEADEYKKLEGDKAKAIVAGGEQTVNLFIENSNKWAVNPALGKAAPASPGAGQPDKTNMDAGGEITPDLRSAMAAEFAANRK
jgi:hypothetical protein